MSCPHRSVGADQIIEDCRERMTGGFDAGLSTFDLGTAASATPEVLEIAQLSPGNLWHAKCIAG
jgi:hypothetical protein